MSIDTEAAIHRALGNVTTRPAGDGYLGKGDGSGVIVADISKRTLWVQANKGEPPTPMPLVTEIDIRSFIGVRHELEGMRVTLGIPPRQTVLYVTGYDQGEGLAAVGGITPSEQLASKAQFPDVGSIINFRLSPNNPADTEIYINPGWYKAADGLPAFWGGDSTVDLLTDAIAALSASEHQMAVVYIDNATGEPAIITNTAESGGINDKQVFDTTSIMEMAHSAGEVLTGAVHLYYGQTTIAEDDIYRSSAPRLMFEATGTVTLAFDVAADSGTPATISNTDTLTVVGVGGATTSIDALSKTLTIDVSGASSGIDIDIDGTPLGSGFTTINFTGGSGSDPGGGVANVNISGSGSATTTRNPGILNGSFEVWENGTSTAPDNWAVTGSGATIAREGTIVRHGLYSASLTRVGNDATFMTDMYTRAGSTFVRSRQYTIGAWVYATVASRVRLRADDGVTVSTSSYHTGGSTWEWLTLTYTPGAAVTQFKVGFEVISGNTSGYLDAIALVEGSVMSAGYYPGTVAINSLPRAATFDHRFSRVVAGAAIVSGVGSGPQLGGSVSQGTGVINDAWEEDFYMGAGSYTLSMFGETFTNRGISSIYIDEVLQGTIDWYSGVGVANLYKTLAVVVVGDGYHVLKVLMATKNASATSYALNVPALSIR